MYEVEFASLHRRLPGYPVGEGGRAVLEALDAGRDPETVDLYLLMGELRRLPEDDDLEVMTDDLTRILF